MIGNTNSKNEYVKKQTMLMAMLITFALGFIGGIVFAVYKTPSHVPHQKTMAMPSSDPHQGISQAQASQLLELKKIADQKPGDAGVWANLGNAYFDTHNYKKAIEAYQKCLEIKPGNTDVLTDMGIMYRKIGRFAEAIKAFDQAIQINPKVQVARFNKGIVLMHDLQDVKKAVKEWEKLVEIYPDAAAPNGQSVSSMIKKMKSKM